jgi:prepilin-type processing-associated H-X9-DG protein/prepilin-type N-terminal cleavage/methylation domain-containing protein
MLQLPRKGAVAFSLIEILAAIAIIGVLAILAVNWLGASSAKSKEVKCLNNLKQLGMATQLYCADNLGALPMRGSAPYSSPPWYQPIVAYVSANMKNGSQIAIESAGLKTFQCPAYKPPPARDVTYAPNLASANINTVGIIKPSKKIWLVTSTDSYSVNSSGLQRINFPHNQRAGILYFDGHAELLNRTDLSAIASFAFNPTAP